MVESPRVKQLREADRASNTTTAYASNWRSFEAWCSGRDVVAGRVDETVVAEYLAHLYESGSAPSSIARVYSALLAKLRETAPEVWPQGLRPYNIAQTLRGIRSKSERRVVQKRALTAEDMSKIVAKLGHDMKDTRDRALLLVGLMGGLRRSELIALDVEVLETTDEGLKIFIPKSKTDQQRRGRTVGLLVQQNEDECPVRAVKEWLRMAAIERGAIFRPVYHGVTVDRRLNDRMVARIVKDAVASIGLNPNDFSGHSLRAGFVTTAAKQKKSLRSIMSQTGHKSETQVMGYIRPATVFEDNATEDFMSSKKVPT